MVICPNIWGQDSPGTHGCVKEASSPVPGQKPHYLSDNI